MGIQLSPHLGRGVTHTGTHGGFRTGVCPRRSGGPWQGRPQACLTDPSHRHSRVQPCRSGAAGTQELPRPEPVVSPSLPGAPVPKTLCADPECVAGSHLGPLSLRTPQPCWSPLTLSPPLVGPPYLARPQTQNSSNRQLALHSVPALGLIYCNPN